MKNNDKLDWIDKTMLWFMIIMIMLGFIAFIWMIVDKEIVCEESNGISKGFGSTKCINESGIYEIVYLNDEWRLIK